MQYKGAPYPPFVFEIVYSQNEKNLLEKAKEYFAEVHICTVLAFDINCAYRAGRLALNYLVKCLVDALCIDLPG